jgi:hypothetical protein
MERRGRILIYLSSFVVKHFNNISLPGFIFMLTWKNFSLALFISIAPSPLGEGEGG